MRVCIVGASGKLGRYMVRHALDRGYDVVGVCREKSVRKLAELKARIQSRYTVFMFRNVDDLKRQVVADLAQLKSEHSK